MQLMLFFLVSTSPLRFGLLAFSLTVILNLITHPYGRLESILGPSGLYLLLCLYTYCLMIIPKISSRKWLIYLSLIILILSSLWSFSRPHLPLSASGSVARSALATPRSLILGVGTTGFTDYFRLVKPLSLNSTDLFNFVPTVSGNTLFHLFTTLGLLGLLAFLSLPLLAIYSHHTNIYLLLSIVLITLLSPPSYLTLFLYFTLLALSSSYPPKILTLSPRVSTILGILTLILATAMGLVLYFVLSTQLSLVKAERALKLLDSQTAYEQSYSATRHLIGLTTPHLRLSRINFLLASGLAQKSPLSDEDKSQVAHLLSAAVQQAQIAISLYPTDAYLWANLASLYNAIGRISPSSLELAHGAYTRALALDPSNVVLRLEYANLLILQDKIDQARSELQLILQLKNDYAEAQELLLKLD